MNSHRLNQTNNFGFCSSIKSSKIPRIINFVGEIHNQKDNKLNELNLNGKKSRIPIKTSRTRSIANSLTEDQIRGSDYQNEKKTDNNLINESKSESNDLNCWVKLRSVRGRSGLTLATNGRTKSDPSDYLHLKSVLEIVRSNLSADNKFRAIKRHRDKRLGFISEMQTYSDGNCDDRVREWVDSGYMSNTNSIREPEDLFTCDESKSGTAVDTTPVSLRHSQQLWSRRRSYNNKRAMDLIALNNKYNSFNSDVSMSSISSIESLLESRREDPEELLLSLGFGYVSDEQQINRIPQRFLESPSSARGVNPETFRKSLGLIDFSSLSSSTSFSPTDTRERSYSCGRISERFRNRINSKELQLKLDLPEITTSSPSMQSPQAESILNPANRKFLENQGKQEDNQNQLGSKRLIIGTKSYKLDHDGDPLAFPKTPSPQPNQETTNSVQIDNQTQVSESNCSQISCNANEINVSESFKRNQLQRQKCVSDHGLDFDKSNQSSSLTDLSSELSSSTTTLVGTVVSTTNENAANDTLNNLSDNYMSSDKCNAFTQTDSQMTINNANEAVEAAIEVAIQSLRLSLELYRHQSLESAKLSAQKYQESSSHFTEEDLNRLSNIHQLRGNIHKGLIDMDTLLNRHLNDLKTSKALEMSFVSQAQIFNEATKKMTELLKEQQKETDC